MESISRKKLKHSKGFITITLVISVSLFSLIVYLSIAFMHGLKHHNQTYFSCYQTGAKIQNKLKGYLTQLLQLNPKAQHLRKRRLQAEIKYKIALDTLVPVNIAIARAYLYKVKVQQKMHSMSQKKWIYKGLVELNREWNQFRKKSRLLIKNVYKKKSKPLAVYAKPLDSDSPDYVLEKSFSKKQELRIYWKMNIFKFVSKDIHRMFSFNQYGNHFCAVSLENQKNQFFIKIMK